MAVNVTPTLDAEYTWASSAFTWQDAKAQKTWAWAGVVSFALAADDPIAIAEAVRRGFSKIPKETIALAEKLGRNITLKRSEAIAIAELLRKNGTLTKSEAMALVEVFSFHRTIVLNEALSVSDSLKRSAVRRVAESIGIAETYTDLIAYWLRVFESVSISEKRHFDRPLNVAESIVVAEKLGKTAGLNKSEFVALTEVLARQILVRRNETFGVAENAARDRGLGMLNESISISESFRKVITKRVSQTLGVAELFGRTAHYNLSIAQGVSVQESLKKAVTLPQSEAIAIFEEYPRRGNAVISDMILSTDELTLEAFRMAVDSGHAPGYKPFRDFIPGDYEYQKALFRTILQSENADRAKLTQLRVEIDVPDVNDRGSATITDATTGVRVNFARPFYTVPEVTLTLKGGSTFAIPKLIDPDETGFTAVLIDPTTGSQATGTFTWAADGY